MIPPIRRPILGNRALDRLANARYQIVVEGTSYRERLSPHQRLMVPKEVIDPKNQDLIIFFTSHVRGGLIYVAMTCLMILTIDTYF